MKLATTGIELAGEFGLRFAQIASGVLAGMADTLDKPAADKASSEARKPS
jgi:hypothetical protein